MGNEQNRDFRQRSLGCVGASMVLHVGLVTMLVLAPESEALQAIGTPEGIAPGAVTVELETPSTGMNEPSTATVAPDAKPADIAASVPSEVLLASNDDPTAVALPSKQVEVVKPKAIAAPVLKEPAKPKAVAKPAPVPKAQTVARADGDVEIANALAAARIDESQKALDIGQREDTISPATSEPEAPVTEQESEDEQEIETASATAAASIAAAEVAKQPEPAVEEPAKTVEQEAPKVAALVQKPAPQPQTIAPQASAPAQAAPQVAAPAQAAPIATGPAQAMAAPMSQQGTGGTTAQPGVAAARPGAPVQGQSVRVGGLGYAVPMGTQIRDASELVARAGNPSPIYPQQDRLLGRQGLAVVVGRVSNDGSILSVQLERSSGSASMDQEAMKAFAKWKFMPGQQGMVRKPFKFVLSGATQELPAKLRY